MFNGSRLEELRLLNGLTRADLARELEVTEQAIWQFETGVTLPKMKNKIAMARFFQVEVDYFDAVDKNGSFSLSRIAFRNADLEKKKKHPYPNGIFGKNESNDRLFGELCIHS